MSDAHEHDERRRPPDPAGTQPSWDPEALLPKATPRAAAGRLWAPDGAGAEDATAVAAEPTVEAPPDDDEDGDGGHRLPPYSARFQFLLGALLAVGASAILLLVAALVSDHAQRERVITVGAGPQWSKWSPKAPGGIEAAEEIAEHVGAEYRLPNGQQLVGVSPTTMTYGDLPVTIAIQKPVSSGGIDFVDGVGVWFHMCDYRAPAATSATSPHCAITYGKPTQSRHLLLRREALELALYAFRYLGVTQVVVSLPPASQQSAKAGAKAGGDDPQVLLFRRDQKDISAAMGRRLDKTLSTKAPTMGTVTGWPDAKAVRTLTKSKVFTFRLQPGNQEPRAFMVLTPVPVP